MQLLLAYITGFAAIGRGMYGSCCFLCWKTVLCDELGLAVDGLTVPNPALSVAVARSAWTAVWNVGRVAAKVEVTSSRSFLFIFLFPEFHCYYSNNRWFKLSALCFHSASVTVVSVNKMLILEICADQKQIVLWAADCVHVYFFFSVPSHIPLCLVRFYINDAHWAPG